MPRFLRDDAVGLFRADERVFDAMLDGWSAQMLTIERHAIDSATAYAAYIAAVRDA